MQSLCGQSPDAFPLRSLGELLDFEVDFPDSLANLVCPSHWSVDDMRNSFNDADDDAEDGFTVLICCHQLWPRILETYFSCRLVIERHECYSCVFACPPRPFFSRGSRSEDRNAVADGCHICRRSSHDT